MSTDKFCRMLGFLKKFLVYESLFGSSVRIFSSTLRKFEVSRNASLSCEMRYCNLFLNIGNNILQFVSAPSERSMHPKHIKFNWFNYRNRDLIKYHEGSGLLLVRYVLWAHYIFSYYKQIVIS